MSKRQTRNAAALYATKIMHYAQFVERNQNRFGPATKAIYEDIYRDLVKATMYLGDAHIFTARESRTSALICCGDMLDIAARKFPW